MLAYYSPSNYGVTINHGDSGSFTQSCWVGNYPAFNNTRFYGLTMVDNIVRLATQEEMDLRDTVSTNVIVVTQANKTTGNSGILRWKTQEELDADIAQALLEEQNRANAAAIALSALIEFESQLDNGIRIVKGLALTLLDEVNLLRSWFVSFKVTTASAISLADFKTRVAALPDMPERTVDQLKTAVYNKAKLL